MKKLKLNLDDLKVQSFETAPQEAAAGTVQGHEMTEHTRCWGLCGGATDGICNSQECFTADYACTWDPAELTCYTNGIAHPTLCAASCEYKLC